MYPFKSSNVFVRNCWYIGAFTDEIRERPVQRTIMDEPVVFYRGESGQVRAMFGLCPHRFYPLAEGRVTGDAIECNYHGFTIDASGACIRIPSQTDCPKQFRQKIYPVIESGPFIWIWMGDPAQADVAALPDQESLGLATPGWTACGLSRFDVQSRYQLLIDNLMDLTHVDFLHGRSVGSGANLSDAVLTLKDFDGGLQVIRDLPPAPWIHAYDFFYGPQNKFDGLCRTYTLTHFYGPSMIKTTGPIFTAIDGMDAPPPELGVINFVHGITPETKSTSHYWGAVTRNFRLEDQDLGAVLADMDTRVRAEDVEAFRLMEPYLDTYADANRELLAKADMAAVRVRRMIQAQLDAQAAPESARVPA